MLSLLYLGGKFPPTYHSLLSSHKKVSPLDLLNTFPFTWISLKGSEEVSFISQAAFKTILFSKKFYMPFIIPEGIYEVPSSFS